MRPSSPVVHMCSRNAPMGRLNITLSRASIIDGRQHLVVSEALLSKSMVFAPAYPPAAVMAVYLKVPQDDSPSSRARDGSAFKDIDRDLCTRCRKHSAMTGRDCGTLPACLCAHLHAHCQCWTVSRTGCLWPRAVYNTQSWWHASTREDVTRVLRRLSMHGGS